jgi:hypothetical protein
MSASALSFAPQALEMVFRIFRADAPPFGDILKLSNPSRGRAAKDWASCYKALCFEWRQVFEISMRAAARKAMPIRRAAFSKAGRP